MSLYCGKAEQESGRLATVPRCRTARLMHSHKLVSHAEQVPQDIACDAGEANQHGAVVEIVVSRPDACAGNVTMARRGLTRCSPSLPNHALISVNGAANQRAAEHGSQGASNSRFWTLIQGASIERLDAAE